MMSNFARDYGELLEGWGDGQSMINVGKGFFWVCFRDFKVKFILLELVL